MGEIINLFSKKNYDHEKGIIFFLMKRTTAIEYIKNKLEYMTFQDPINEKIKNFIFDNSDFVIKSTTVWENIINYSENKPYRDRVLEIYNRNDIDIKSDETLKGYIKTARLDFLENQIIEIDNLINSFSSSDNLEEIVNLMSLSSTIRFALEEETGFTSMKTIIEEFASPKNIGVTVWDKILNEAKKDVNAVNAAILLNAQCESIDHKKRVVTISFLDKTFESTFKKRWHGMSKYLTPVFGKEYRLVIK